MCRVILPQTSEGSEENLVNHRVERRTLTASFPAEEAGNHGRCREPETRFSVIRCVCLC